MSGRSTRVKIKDQYRGIQADLDGIIKRLAVIDSLETPGYEWTTVQIPIMVNMINEVKKAFEYFRTGL